MKIAIYRNDNIGDLIISLPFINAVRTHFVESTIVLYGNKQTEQVARLINIIDEFRLIQEASIESIRQDQLNMCFFVGPIAPYEIEKLFVDAHVPVRIAMRDQDKFNTLTKRFDGPTSQDYGHVALNDFKMLAQFGIPQPSLESIKEQQNQFFETQHLAPYFDAPLHYVVMHTKSNKNGKEWPIKYFNELKQELLIRGLSVVFTGSMAEKDQALRECPDLLEGESVIDLFGKTTTNQFFCVLKFSNAVVCSGTGPLHLAAGLDVATVGLFPPYLEGNVKRWGPLGRKTIFLEGTGGCKKPWYKKYLKHRQCNKVGTSCACMINIKLSDVLNAVIGVTTK